LESIESQSGVEIAANVGFLDTIYSYTGSERVENMVLRWWQYFNIP